MSNKLKELFNKVFGKSYRKKMYCEECKNNTEKMKKIDRRKFLIDGFVLLSVIIVSIIALTYTIPADKLYTECEKMYVANNEMNKLCVQVNCWDYTFDNLTDYIEERNKNPYGFDLNN